MSQQSVRRSRAGTRAHAHDGPSLNPPDRQNALVPALETIISSLDTTTSRLLTAHLDGQLAGWLSLRRDPWTLISHWGTLHHVQTRTTMRGQGIGNALMNEARRIARDEMDLEQLHLAARGGIGLETFYGRLGWKETGRWPGALRLADGKDHDEVLMLLTPCNPRHPPRHAARHSRCRRTHERTGRIRMTCRGTRS
ncbi:GNAT family N-acetyltransferase [Streptomyces sp. NPDC057575]|uniref:GNAT family N-acetyltransferase n=1 Tax=unclassified Streptomyces TaxID=2593676 RepID=UPI0036C1D922